MAVAELRERMEIGDMSNMILCQSMFAPQFRFLQLALDRGHQPADITLDYVILGAEAHQLHRAFFADRAGYDDERQIAIVFADDLQRLDPVESRHREVGKHDIPA